ncbi:MAG TPA: D-alanine--poly(phosphoribitol) ligase subunit DltA [Syntrophaceticus sp.]|jgi:D-alanine--poly(phosphoribitol) ligase subunit 1|nr:D-alanine--poly(phosphoribitol) ligase subunit DltA [Syntrophaceticus sp.]
MYLPDIIDNFGKTNNIAHIYRENILTYEDLKKKSDALAFYLIKILDHDQSPIIVYGHKENEMLICFLACVKSGHPYVPLDSSIPDQRVKRIIERSGSKLIFCLEEIVLDTTNIMIIDNTKINELISSFLGKTPDIKFRVHNDDVFYIIYTSGSTGNPKGVQITLSSLDSFVKWGLNICNLNNKQQYVFMNQAPFSFDLSVMDLYLSLASGSTLFSIDKQMISNLGELFRYFSQAKINVWVSTPSFAELCLADKSFNDLLLPDLKLFLFCGEVLSNKCAEKLLERFKNARIFNMYGPTETTVAVTAVEITQKLCKSYNPLPVGYAKNDCKIFIIDSDGEIISDENKKGEIYIAGDSVSIGYYKDEDITKKAFSKITLDGQEKRCYKTGDLGYYKDGMLHYSGRIDYQIKLSGHRIELEEIDNALRELTIIKHATVIPVSKNGRIHYLTAVVVLNRAFEQTDFEIGLLIKKELSRILPDYMIPRKIIFRESVPLTINGKINRKALTEELQ